MKFANQRFPQCFYRAITSRTNATYQMDFYTTFSHPKALLHAEVIEFPQNFYYALMTRKNQAA